jgi:hypothetical protein
MTSKSSTKCAHLPSVCIPLSPRIMHRLGKAVSHLAELVAGNLHGEVCDGGCHSTGSPLLGGVFSTFAHRVRELI